MKKLIITALLATACIETSAQFSMDVSLVNRMEFSPMFGFGNGENQYTSGNSSFYTNFDLYFGEHCHLGWVSHWLDSGGLSDKGYNFPYCNTPALYGVYDPYYPNPDGGHSRVGWNFLRSDRNNFLDYLYLDFTNGPWLIRVGKSNVAIASFEYEYDDWECDYNMMSLFWSNGPAYQWGASVQLSTPSEKSSFMLQAAASPYAGYLSHPFSGCLGIYSFQYDGNYNKIRLSASTSFARTNYYGGRSTIYIVAANGMYTPSEKFNCRLEANMRIDGMRTNSCKVVGGLDYYPSDRWELQLRAGYEKIGMAYEVENWEIEGNTWFTGMSAFWFPIRDNRDLRLHAVVGTNGISKSLNLTLGFLYSHTFHCCAKRSE